MNQSNPHNSASLQELLKNVNAGGNVTVGAINQQQTTIYSNSNMPVYQDPKKLEDRDYTLIIDRSPSMVRPESEGSEQSRWNAIKEATIKLAKEIEKYNPDGITIYTFSDQPTRYDHVNYQKAKEIFQVQKPDSFGVTNIGLVLEDALKSYFNRRQAHQTKANGETILVVTDGEASDPLKVEKVIIDASKNVSGKGELGISFIQIGTDEKATDFLKNLDDSLVSHNGAKVDIVDTKTFEEIAKKGLEIYDILMDALYD